MGEANLHLSFPRAIKAYHRPAYSGQSALGKGSGISD
jgi:hypothetical protein